MKELALMLASVMSRDQLVEELEKSLDKWRSDKSDQNFDMLAMACVLVGSKKMTDQKDVIDIIKDMDLMTQGAELLKPKNQ